MVKWIFLGLLAPAISELNSQILKKPVPDKLVVLTFDDAIKSHYTTVAPLLKQYGFGATFFICEFPPDFSDTTKYMTWAQIQQLSKNGFEIGNHTRNHPDIDGLSANDFAREIDYIEQKCIALKIPKPTSFAYPGGYITHAGPFKTLEKNGYQSARTAVNHEYNPLTDHPYLVPGFTVSATNRREILNALKKATNGKIVVLTFHGVPDKAHPWVTTPPELFKEYMRYLHDNHYKVIAMIGLSEYINVEKALKEIKPGFPKKSISKKVLILIIGGLTGMVASAIAYAKFRKKKKSTFRLKSK